MGKEKGIEEIAKRFQAKPIPDIKTNKWGTPYLDGLIEKVVQVARFEILVLINADCILVGDLEQVVETIYKRFSQFLAIATRYDSKIQERLPVLDWKSFALKNKGIPHPLFRQAQGKKSVGGMDIWIFSKTLYPKIPPFLVGRLNWDSWLVSNVYERQIPIIDISEEIFLIHQLHLLRKYKKEPMKTEIKINQQLIIGIHKRFVKDANFILKDGKFEKNKGAFK